MRAPQFPMACFRSQWPTAISVYEYSTIYATPFIDTCYVLNDPPATPRLTSVYTQGYLSLDLLFKVMLDGAPLNQINNILSYIRRKVTNAFELACN
jgi:hypothetical protein